MANISKFNREEVLEKAKNLFWQKGFLATSTREIQTTMDMRPGSIYAAFGSKADLFHQTLIHYVQTSTGDLNEKIAQSDSAWNGFKQYLRSIIVPCCAEVPSELCMVVRTLAELDESHQETLNIAKDLLTQVEHRFASIIEKAQHDGDLPSKLDKSQVAKKLQVHIIGLRSYLKATGDTDTVNRELEEFFIQLES
ncbi:TetR/AcrR family transcriptional regulator [Shewanella sp. SR43-4]|jgi:TetR/AcrR family transcriptional repressor of nem operon|uniref:TetR/AcrR family transcriptional regulator n=1 Tax=Shewanella vesiculosa TaxID=518738 RepID=A0ABV0FRG2_9GAMM|nr:MULTISPECIES: TetR/AcrR family transcriptional regulator [Shewanella]NCQ43794.1 TetR/AcrR family transcriptional regulator [Shewanella frigidimarina]MBB1317005.1 TetR/AcrR family transcriptional regulator [Shewanella sp. SR43-4]MBB1321884.1 TetR/AcrR family transcriptional regulator [Shewanella sp. SR43-8]MBB1391389.1 TetR/AcrR family transcriptional regulator [Shewanella sp. SG44-6]MBB1476540.1 TetR/AcrR family transcriptional regulator [Shewanella sp. SG41-3]|tara:strand:+ start:2871 stop:3455 length:585 start_codon:yes stop_codon:yes gene_type:complete